MEKILAVKEHQESTKDRSLEEKDPERHDVYEADALEEAEGRDRSRQRYQRLFWESVPESGKVNFPSVVWRVGLLD